MKIVDLKVNKTRLYVEIVEKELLEQIREDVNDSGNFEITSEDLRNAVVTFDGKGKKVCVEIPANYTNDDDEDDDGMDDLPEHPPQPAITKPHVTKRTGHHPC